jgi:hypothetical protein
MKKKKAKNTIVLQESLFWVCFIGLCPLTLSYRRLFCLPVIFFRWQILCCTKPSSGCNSTLLGSFDLPPHFKDQTVFKMQQAPIQNAWPIISFSHVGSKSVWWMTNKHIVITIPVNKRLITYLIWIVYCLHPCFFDKALFIKTSVPLPFSFFFFFFF